MSSPTAPSLVSDNSPHLAFGVTNARRWTIVGLLFTASLINYFDRATISFALPLISTELSLGPIEKGKLLSAFFVSYALMQIPLGWSADRVNLRWLYAGAFTLWSIAQGLMGLAGGLVALMAFRVLLGVGEAIYLPGGSKIVSLLFSPTERGLPSGLFDFGTRTGLVIEGLLVPWMLTEYGWRKTFMIVGFSALVWLVPWMLALPGNLADKRRQTSNAATRGGRFLEFLTVLVVSACLLVSLFVFSLLRVFYDDHTALAGAICWWFFWIFILWFSPLRALQSSHAGTARSLAQLLAVCRNRNLIGICVGFFCFDYYWYFLVNWLPDYLVTSRGLTILRAGIYATLPYLVFGVSEPIGGWIADRLVSAGWNETRARKGIVTVAFLTGLLLIPAARVNSPGAAVALIIGGCLVGLSTGNLLVILQSCSPPAEVGLWTGVYNFVGNVAGIVSPLITGLLIQKTGSYTPPFVLAAALIAVGPLAFWFIVGELKCPDGNRDH